MDIKEMDVIALTRELGKKIQQEDAYLKYQIAKQHADEDAKLQELIVIFGEKRDELAAQSKLPEEERDNEKIQQSGKEMRRAYGEIMSNESMMAYNEAKDEFDIIMNRINAIIQKSFEGEDPETADFSAECSGSCATCGGCG